MPKRRPNKSNSSWRNNPVTYTDPFGLSPDSTYNIMGVAINAKGGATQHYLSHGGQEYRLDYKLTPGSTPYGMFTTGAMNFMATSLGASAPSYGNRLAVEVHSLPGGTLDMKRNLPARALWNAGGGLLVHSDKVGNAAWGYYMARQGYTIGQALSGASLQGRSVGGEDPLDQAMIRRGFGLYR